MLLEAIYHKPYSEYAFALDKDTLVLRLRAKKGDLINVIVIYNEKYEPSLKGTDKMLKVATDDLFDYFEVRLSNGIRRLKYMFYLEAAKSVKWYTAAGFFDNRPEWEYFTYSNLYMEDYYHAPEWLKNAVIYQIFPDRFHKPQSNSGFKELSKWMKTKGNCYTHFGGNIKGVTEKLEYLSGLGVNTIYLNPVFKANSYHGYDTVDYYSIDPRLGSLEELKELVRKCHEKNIRIILDAVFNHCSPDFFAFKDVVLKGGASAYKDWFIIDSYPIKTKPEANYECFGFFCGMPKLNTRNGEVKKYLGDVAVHWLELLDIDGWRFDVADEIDHQFWRYINLRVKEKKKDAVLMGEIWDEASPWLKGEQFDTSMNYPVKSLINDLFAYKSANPKQFKQKLTKHIMNYKSPVINNLVNMIGTHDTPRFLTLCKGNKDMFKLAVVFQFTFPGVPMIYYGDEVGMKGEGDPECRMPMLWNEKDWDLEILDLYRFLTKLRKDFPVFIEGSYSERYVKGQESIVVFERKSCNEGAIILLNVSEEKCSGNINLEKVLKTGHIFTDIKKNKVMELVGNSLAFDLEPLQWQIVYYKKM